MTRKCGRVGATTDRVVLHHTPVGQYHVIVVVCVTVSVILVVSCRASSPEDSQRLRSEPAHAQHVYHRVYQGVESYRDDVGKQPNVLLEEMVGIVNV